MSGASETLRMKNDLGRAVEKAVGCEGFDAFRHGRLDACAGRDHAYAERWGHSAFASLPMSGVSRHNRGK
jgi:hypothetical protein